MPSSLLSAEESERCHFSQKKKRFDDLFEESTRRFELHILLGFPQYRSLEAPPSVAYVRLPDQGKT
jgi:hypothetical protein